MILKNTFCGIIIPFHSLYKYSLQIIVLCLELDLKFSFINLDDILNQTMHIILFFHLHLLKYWNVKYAPCVNQLNIISWLKRKSYK